MPKVQPKEFTGWSRLLANVVRELDGTMLRTLDDARRYVLSLPKSRQQRQAWLSATQAASRRRRSGRNEAD
jgi:hypothetical protein